MAEDIGSTVPRRQLGRLLRQFRNEAGVTLDAAAEALEYSRQKIWRLECGMGSVRVLDVKAMCELYGVSPEMTEAMRGLAVETKSKGWWHAYGDAVPSWFELYVGLESAASRLRGYDESLIPGILQTKEYAHALIRLGRMMSDEEREQAVEVRIQRQALLTRRLPAARAWSRSCRRRCSGAASAVRRSWAANSTISSGCRVCRTCRSGCFRWQQAPSPVQWPAPSWFSTSLPPRAVGPPGAVRRLQRIVDRGALPRQAG